MVGLRRSSLKIPVALWLKERASKMDGGVRDLEGKVREIVYRESNDGTGIESDDSELSRARKALEGVDTPVTLAKLAELMGVKSPSLYEYKWREVVAQLRKEGLVNPGSDKN